MSKPVALPITERTYDEMRDRAGRRDGVKVTIDANELNRLFMAWEMMYRRRTVVGRGSRGQAV